MAVGWLNNCDPRDPYGSQQWTLQSAFPKQVFSVPIEVGCRLRFMHKFSKCGK